MFISNIIQRAQVLTLLLASLILASVFQGYRNKPEQDQHYSRLEIYCWCFSAGNDSVTDGGIIITKLNQCQTIARVEPFKLIKPEFFFDSTGDIKVVGAMQRLIFDQKIKSEETSTGNVDARFVMVFRKSDSKADIVAYHSGNKLSYNDRYLFTYNFNIMDSIRSILHKDKISCK
ncbi:MAG TPA: hypothetical protein VIZ28_11460 [Chitinophagaceae bacterium]